MSIPRATLRLQFHRGFTFADACARVSYFAALGVSHIYASPIMTARPGSMHGYDVIDPTTVNPELGGEDELRRLVAALREQGLGLIVDIVPNHMATDAGNAWWMDVLARGRSGPFAKYFDIDWDPPNPHLKNKVLLPILGRPYGEALDAGEIRLERDSATLAYSVRYFDFKLPVAAESPLDSADAAEFDVASSKGRARLHALLEAQHYRLAWWRTANDTINWRRFFDINELVAVRIEDDEVFDAVHDSLFRLYEQELIDGVRVDHIDGLTKPGDYCRKLRARLRALAVRRPSNAGDTVYFVVEKILARGERLPADWETDGTTGYDFMDQISAVQHDEAGARPLAEFWHRVSGRPEAFEEEEDLARRQILERSFSAQREALVTSLTKLAESELTTRDYSRSLICRCLTEILANFPVYRIYARVADASESDRRFLAEAIRGAEATCLSSDRWLMPVLGKWLRGQSIAAALNSLQNVALARFQQLSAPLCAKAVEDTAFYRYGRLISRNDVGFDARRFSCPVGEFHRLMQERCATLPNAMLATATHDHKRGEDVRARLAVLSELPAAWTGAVDRWIELSAPHRVTVEGVVMPAAGNLAILFQAIVGAWPFGLGVDDREGLAVYAERIAAWQQKALREAKLRSDWSEPNLAYEGAARGFIEKLFAQPSPLLAEIIAFAQRVAAPGAANSLAQLLVKLTAPGVPDIFQGTDYWDLSLVDPDNRSPVDFALRQRFADMNAPQELLENWQNGHIKQALAARVLALRKEHPRLFSDGTYLPINASGGLADHVIAFARKLRNMVAIVVVCRLTAQVHAAGSLAFKESVWQDTRLVVPPDLYGMFSHTLTLENAVPVSGDVAVAQILNRWPVALLVRQPR